MLRTYLKLNFVFGANRNEYKGRCVFVYLQEGKNHEKQLRQVVLNNSGKQLLQGVLKKAVKVSKSTGDDHAEDVFQ